MLTRMTDVLAVYARTEETETVVASLAEVPAWVSDELPAAAVLRHDPMLELQMTHVARVPYELARAGLGAQAADSDAAVVIETGNRVRRAADGAEFLVKGIRHHDRPGHRCALLLLSRAGNTIGV